ncbi:hypothetical protein ACB524_004388 [Salmonella enterica]
MRNTWKKLVFFDVMWTPRILVGLYWLSMVFVVLASFLTLIDGGIFRGVASLIGGILMCRIGYELLILAFKNNELLRMIEQNTRDPKEDRSSL